MALWGGNVCVVDRAAAYQVRVKDGRTQVRAGDGEWRSSDENAITFAPEGDFLAFLDVATNITLANDRVPTANDPACATLDCGQISVYSPAR